MDAAVALICKQGVVISIECETSIGDSVCHAANNCAERRMGIHLQPGFKGQYC